MLKLGNVHISSEGFYALLAVLLLLVVIYLDIPLPYVSAPQLLLVTIIFLIARAFLPDVFIGWILGIFLLVFVLKIFFSLPFATLIVALLVLFLVLGLVSHRP